MKTKLFLIVFFLLKASLYSEPLFSGFLDIQSRITLNAAENDFYNNKINTGFASFANLRLDEKLRDNLRFYSAFNAAAASGEYYNGWQPVSSGQNYAGYLDIERLYIRASADKWGLDLGLMPLHFGYGAVFGPSDFLVQRSPAVSDARPRGILGEAFYLYPADDIRVFQFAAYPRDPGAANLEFSNGHLGAGFDAHFGKASVQALYSYEAPDPRYYGRNDKHYFGGSFKFEAGASFFIDALYTLSPNSANNIHNLAASAGLDYSFFDGKLYALCEYFFNGENNNYTSLRNLNYIDALLRFSISDLISVTAQTLFSISDLTMLPALIYSQEIMQGITLTFTAQVPLDLENNAQKGEFSRGEFSPHSLGGYFIFIGKLRIRL